MSMVPNASFDNDEVWLVLLTFSSKKAIYLILGSSYSHLKI